MHTRSLLWVSATLISLVVAVDEATARGGGSTPAAKPQSALQPASACKAMEAVFEVTSKHPVVIERLRARERGLEVVINHETPDQIEAIRKAFQSHSYFKDRAVDPKRILQMGAMGNLAQIRIQ